MTCMCGAVDVEGNRCELTEEQKVADIKRAGYKEGGSHVMNVDSEREYSVPLIKSVNHNPIQHVHNGRYPAQTYIDDEAAKVLDGQSGNCGGHSVKTKRIYDGKEGTNTYGVQDRVVFSHNDTGGCSRILHRCNYDLNDYDIYHYCPKVSNKERNEGCGMLNEKQTVQFNERMEGQVRSNGTVIKDPKPQQNHHPTVKPIALLKKIIALFKTPNELHVLDPFMGSGSMGIACIELGVSYTGVELDAEYYTIAQTRLAHHDTKNKSKLF
jgi:hypothetical protein